MKLSMMRIIALLSFLLVIAEKSHGQNSKNDDAYLVLYAAGKAGLKDEVKYLLVSTYNIKLADYDIRFGIASFETGVKMQFKKFIEDLNSLDKHYDIYYSLVLNPNSHIADKAAMDIWTRGTPMPHYEFIKIGEENRRSAAVQIRNNLMKDFRDRGYAIRQVKFKPDNTLADYNFMKEMVIEEVDPLMSWEVAVYDKGEISKACKAAAESREEEKKINAAMSKIETDMAINKALAKQDIVKDYDYAKKTGNGGVLNQEEMAKRIIAKCEDFERRYGKDQDITNIKNEVKLWTADGLRESSAQLVSDGIMKAEEAGQKFASDLDALKIPRVRGLMLSYESFLTKYDWNNEYTKNTPWSFTADYGFYRIFALEGGLSYFKSPGFKMTVVDQNGNDAGTRIGGDFTGIAPEVAAGLAWPNKYFNLSVLYGLSFPFVISAENYNPEYNFSSFKDVFQMVTFSKLKANLILIIPKTRIGIGIRYSMNSINGSKIIEGDNYISAKKNNRDYYIGKATESSYKFNQFGVSLFFKGR